MRDNATSTTTAAVRHTCISKGYHWHVHALGPNVKIMHRNNPYLKKIIPKNYDRCGDFSELVFLLAEENAARTEDDILHILFYILYIHRPTYYGTTVPQLDSLFYFRA